MWLKCSANAILPSSPHLFSMEAICCPYHNSFKKNVCIRGAPAQVLSVWLCAEERNVSSNLGKPALDQRDLLLPTLGRKGKQRSRAGSWMSLFSACTRHGANLTLLHCRPWRSLFSTPPLSQCPLPPRCCSPEAAALNAHQVHVADLLYSVQELLLWLPCHACTPQGKAPSL